MNKLILSGAVMASLFSYPTFALEKDKQLHLGVSTAIGTYSQYHLEDWKTSMLVCSSVGAVKEVYDEIDYGGFDSVDMVYNVIGCGVGVFTGNMLTVYKQDDNVTLSFEMKF